MTWRKYLISDPPPKDRWIVFAWNLDDGNAHVARWLIGTGAWEDTEGVTWEDDDLAGSFWLALPGLPAPTGTEEAR